MKLFGKKRTHHQVLAGTILVVLGLASLFGLFSTSTCLGYHIPILGCFGEVNSFNLVPAWLAYAMIFAGVVIIV